MAFITNFELNKFGFFLKPFFTPYKETMIAIQFMMKLKTLYFKNGSLVEPRGIYADRPSQELMCYHTTYPL